MAKIAGMPSSSKRPRASSSKKSDAAKARVISISREETLPRKGTASVGRRKPIVEPPFDVPAEAPAPLAGSAKKGRRQQQTETGAIGTKPTRAAGRASRKLKKADGNEILNGLSAAVPETANEVSATTTEALAAAETEMVVEESAILEEATIVEVSVALPVETALSPSTDMRQPAVSEENRAPELAATAANSAAPVASAQRDGKRAVMTALSRVLSTLSRWTRIRL